MIKPFPAPIVGRTYSWEGHTTRYMGTLVKKDGAVLTFLKGGQYGRYLDDGRYLESGKAPEQAPQGVKETQDA